MRCNGAPVTWRFLMCYARGRGGKICHLKVLDFFGGIYVSIVWIKIVKKVGEILTYFPDWKCAIINYYYYSYHLLLLITILMRLLSACVCCGRTEGREEKRNEEGVERRGGTASVPKLHV